jgi:hypothetical protein
MKISILLAGSKVILTMYIVNLYNVVENMNEHFNQTRLPGYFKIARFQAGKNTDKKMVFVITSLQISRSLYVICTCALYFIFFFYTELY